MANQKGDCDRMPTRREILGEDISEFPHLAREIEGDIRLSRTRQLHVGRLGGFYKVYPRE